MEKSINLPIKKIQALNKQSVIFLVHHIMKKENNSKQITYLLIDDLQDTQKMCIDNMVSCKTPVYKITYIRFTNYCSCTNPTINHVTYINNNKNM